jgi:signal peptidase II
MYQGFELKSIKVVSLTVASTAIIDQVTKALVVHYMTLHEMVEVIPGLFNIVYWRNPGAAFGMFKDGGILMVIFLTGITLAAIVIIAILLRYAGDTSTRVALSLIAGGAVGNLIDRLRFGEVVDFLDFYVGRYHWPAFNVADSAITLGVFIFLYLFYVKRPEGEKGEKASI